MSKAFTRESDGDAADLPLPVRRNPLPPGTKNYITADGARRVREELDRLLTERQPLAALDDAASKHRIQVLDQRVARLQEILHSVEIVPPPATPEDKVRFGAFVTVRERSEEIQYRIVGVDETDLDRNWISWLSPLAKTLLNAQSGQRVKFKFPSGEEQLEIIAISYE